jgi:hypothetical protein
MEEIERIDITEGICKVTFFDHRRDSPGIAVIYRDKISGGDGRTLFRGVVATATDGAEWASFWTDRYASEQAERVEGRFRLAKIGTGFTGNLNGGPLQVVLERLGGL